MRLFVFFDLPMTTQADLKVYRDFRRELIKQGFVMMQQSVYTKLCVNNAVSVQAIRDIEKICPDCGLIHVLKVTEKQFCEIVDVNGSEVLNSDALSSSSVVVF